MELTEAMRECVPFGKYRGYPLETMQRDHFPALAKLARGKGYFGAFKEAMNAVIDSERFQEKMERYRKTKRSGGRRGRDIDRMAHKWYRR